MMATVLEPAPLPSPAVAPTPATPPVIVSFNAVAKSFRTGTTDTPAVQGITLDVMAGEILTILGPSGCGKSTLLNMTAGLFAPTAGSVTYRGTAVTGPNTAVGYMTQKDHLLPWRTVAGNIAIPLQIRGLSKPSIRNRVAALMALVGLEGFEASYPAQLSGGMRKRTALARLLAYDPETLLLDEPFAALDPQLRAGMQLELLRLCRDLGKTVMFVTHDLDEAVALGDRCVVFTGRPGTIRAIVDVPLPRDRNPLRLRADETFIRLTASLWDMIVPSTPSDGTPDAETPA
jgi:NitT/TauT family transport system ATP-binding protein